MLGRYGSTNMPITALGCALFGLVLLIAPHSSYSAPVYHVPFSVATQEGWGLGFLVTGIAAMAIVNLITVLALTIVVTGWAALILGSTLTVDGVPPSAPIAWGIIAACLLVSVGRRGIASR